MNSFNSSFRFVVPRWSFLFAKPTCIARADSFGKIGNIDFRRRIIPEQNPAGNSKAWNCNPLLKVHQQPTLHASDSRMRVPDPAIWLYRQMTSRDRRHLLAQLRAECRLPVAILFYHRVAKTGCDNPWSIHLDNFKRQLDWLQSNFEMVSLADAQTRIRGPHNDRISVSITFDDGYADNSEFAIPELVSRKIPLTYFVSTDFVETGRSFPHDIKLGTPLPPNDIPQLQEFVRLGIEIGSHTRSHANIAAVSRADR